MRTCLLAFLLFGFGLQLSADVIPTVPVTELSAYRTQGGFFYSGGGAGFTLAGGAGTGPNDFYPVDSPITLGFTLPGTNTSLGSAMLTVAGIFYVPGGIAGATYFGSATVSPLGASTFTPSGDSATYTFPAAVRGSFVACGPVGYALCATNGTLPANAPVLANVTVDLTGTETLVVHPASQPYLITYSITFDASSVPEPASLGLMMFAGTGLLLFVSFKRRHALLRRHR